MWTRFNYDTALFTADTVTGWIREFERTLRVAAADPDVRLAGQPA